MMNHIDCHGTKNINRSKLSNNPRQLTLTNMLCFCFSRVVKQNEKENIYFYQIHDLLTLVISSPSKLIAITLT